MSFDTTVISNVRLYQRGGGLFVTWASSAAAGTNYQVYIDRRLAWVGRGLSCTVSTPAPGGNHQIDIGSVGAGESRTDFSGSLATTLPANRALLNWRGGRYLSAGLDQFLIYSSTAPGGAISYTAPVGKVTAYPAGIITDGYGAGAYGRGGWGSAAGNYSWTSSPLINGVWNFAVVPVDSAGNKAGSPATTSVTIATPPLPPAANSAGKRLTYSYNPGTRVATLSWLASPG